MVDPNTLLHLTKEKQRQKKSPTASFLFVVSLLVFCLLGSRGENPYRYFTWKVTYGDVYHLGVKAQGIFINGQFPGPHIDAITNDNYLNEPFLISW
ncbi:hypothetical protein GQ457_12G017600 [Hibiscus cannabinus]